MLDQNGKANTNDSLTSFPVENEVVDLHNEKKYPFNDVVGIEKGRGVNFLENVDISSDMTDINQVETRGIKADNISYNQLEQEIENYQNKLKEEEALSAKKLSLNESTNNLNTNTNTKETIYFIDNPAKVHNRRFAKIYKEYLKKSNKLKNMYSNLAAKLRNGELSEHKALKLQNQYNDLASKINSLAVVLKLSRKFLWSYIDVTPALEDPSANILLKTFVKKQNKFKDIGNLLSNNFANEDFEDLEINHFNVSEPLILDDNENNTEIINPLEALLVKSTNGKVSPKKPSEIDDSNIEFKKEIDVDKIIPKNQNQDKESISVTSNQNFDRMNSFFNEINQNDTSKQIEQSDAYQNEINLNPVKNDTYQNEINLNPVKNDTYQNVQPSVAANLAVNPQFTQKIEEPINSDKDKINFDLDNYASENTINHDTNIINISKQTIDEIDGDTVDEQFKTQDGNTVDEQFKTQDGDTVDNEILKTDISRQVQNKNVVPQQKTEFNNVNLGDKFKSSDSKAFFDNVENRIKNLENKITKLTVASNQINSNRLTLLQDDIYSIYNQLNNITTNINENEFMSATANYNLTSGHAASLSSRYAYNIGDMKLNSILAKTQRRNLKHIHGKQLLSDGTIICPYCGAKV